MRLTDRAKLYLMAIDDWKAPFEVARVIPASREPARTTLKTVRATLLRLQFFGYSEHHAGNDTFRITDAGRAALQKDSK